ncbi:hypothetical protein C0991_000967 [Blastosporella zonata]|nr:hypothetical protein C0991_000967 [Blastosporella zonata]
MVDLSGDITHEALVRGAELLKFSPIPGLEGAARVLLGIWDALQQIETNRLACLRLTERCADILIAIQVEISGLDKRVADVLHEPMEKLELAFQEIQLMMMSLIQQPTYRRYFKRDEVLDEIAQCGTKLQDCYSHFDRSIQLRILEFVSSAHQSPGSRTDMSQHTKEQIRESIRRVQERQNELDRSDDLVDEQNYAKTLQSPEKALKALKVEKVDIPDAMKTLLRTLESLRSTDIFDKVSTSIYSPRRSSTWPVSHADANLLLRLRDQEGLERDIRSLKAAYGRPVPTLPNWTITRFEIELGDMIGRGFFSAVYKGKWGTHVVAIKVLEVHTSKESFVNEVDVWKRLSHPNVLELYGASSAEGSFPWFLVSPLMTHGNVADHLKRIHWESQRHKESGDESSGAGSQKVDHLRMMHDIAEGMRYLHHEGIYHGDLKAANTLVADDLRCVVSDFGQSKWMSQVHQKNPLPNHALRWQAPELMGGYSLLTKKIDIYAFAMCCVEILTMGSLPWPNMNDDDVRQHVLDEEGRPPCPENLVRALGIKDLLHAAWHQSPRERPSFKKLAPDLQALRAELRLLDLVPPSPRIVISQPKSTQDLEDISPPLMFTSPGAYGQYLSREKVSHKLLSVSDGSEEPVLMSPRAEYSTPFVTTLPNLDSEIEPHFDNKGNDENEAGSPLLENSLLLFEEAPSTIERDDVTVKEPYEEQFELTYRLCLSHEFPRQCKPCRNG